MKLIVQIALGVFLGTLASQFAIDVWHARQQGIAKQVAEKLHAEQQRIRLEQGERIRALLMQGRKENAQHTPNVSKPATGSAPNGTVSAK